MTDTKGIGATQIGASGGGGGSIVEKINDDQASALTHLLNLANDLCLAYGTARRRLEDPKLREQFEELDKSHDRFRVELAECITDLGHEATATGDWHGVLERGRVVIGDIQGDIGILKAMATNEQEMISAYREAIHKHNLPNKAIVLIERALTHEAKHQEFFDTALQRFVG